MQNKNVLRVLLITSCFWVASVTSSLDAAPEKTSDFLGMATKRVSLLDQIDQIDARLKDFGSWPHWDDEVSNLIANGILPLQTKSEAIRKLLKKKEDIEVAKKLRLLTQDVDRFIAQVKPIAISKFQPLLDKPAETRLSSPWGAVVRIRQESTLRLFLELIPKPASQIHKWHGWSCPQDTAGWIEIQTDWFGENISKTLGLSYNISLKDINYDPLVTRYFYNDGAITLRVLERKAIMVSSDPRKLRIKFNKQKMEFHDGYWIGKSIYKGEPVYCGLVFYGNKVADTDKNGLVPCQSLTICWGDSLDELLAGAASVANPQAVIKATELWEKQVVSPMQLQADARLVKNFEMAKRGHISMQYLFGGSFAALDEYQNFWIRDSGSAAVFAGLSGDQSAIKLWAPYVLNNPEPVEYEKTKYLTFQTFPNGQKFKAEQDGPFYATLAAYAYWKLTGDASHLDKWYPVLKSSIEFLRASAYDHEKQLYMSPYMVESPVLLTKESQQWWKYAAWPASYRGPDTYSAILDNQCMYATHLMMAEMAMVLGKNRQSQQEIAMAENLANAIDQYLWKDSGHYILATLKWPNGRIEELDWDYYHRLYDARMSATWVSFPMAPNPEKTFRSMDGLFTETTDVFGGNKRNFYFAPSIATAAYAYATAGQFNKTYALLELIDKSLDKVDWVSENQMNALYYMKGALCERIDRQIHLPYPWTMSTYMHAVTSLVAAIDYNGITLMPSQYASGLEAVHFRDAVLSIDTSYTGPIAGIVFDGEPLPHTMKIPTSLLMEQNHQVKLLPDTNLESTSPILLYTPFELLDVKNTLKGIEYDFKGYGKAILRFDNKVTQKQIDIHDLKGMAVPYEFWRTGNGFCLQVFGKGDFIVSVHAVHVPDK